MKKLVFLLSVFVVFFFLIRLGVDSTKTESTYSKAIKIIEQEDYNGVVTKKTRDLNNHNTPVIVFKNQKRIWVYDEFYDLIELSDSLSKAKNDLLVHVFRGENYFKIDYQKILEKRYK